MKRKLNGWLSLFLSMMLALYVSLGAAEGLPAEENAELFGSPWINSS